MMEEEVDFVLEFETQDEAEAAAQQLKQINGMHVSTSLVPPTRIGAKASFDLLLVTCERERWKRRLKHSDEWVTFAWSTRAEFANVYHEQGFFSSAERVYLTSLLLREVHAKHVIALNDLELHRELNSKWITAPLFSPQPLKLIRDYYGEEIALYFGFLGHYTAWLVPLAVLGVFTYAYQLVYGMYSWPSVAFAVITMLWDTVYFESWKRKEKLLAYEWNGISARTEEIKRVLYYKYKVHWVIGYSLSFLLLAASFVSKTWLLISILLYGPEFLAPLTKGMPLASKFPSMILALAIVLTSNLNKGLAVFCSRALEQRETLDEVKNAIVVKLTLQHFLNSHAVLFYIAFVEQDIDRLKSTLISLVVLNQIYGQILEVGIPSIKSGMLKQWIKHNRERSQIDTEMSLDTFAGVFADYLELWVQLSQLTLYSSIFPLTAFVALVNNVIEVRTDAFRLMHTSKRPIPFSKPRDIGNWQPVFEMLGFVSLATNAALAYVVISQHECIMDCWRDVELMLTMVALEHVALAGKMCLRFFIPDVPREIAAKLEANSSKEMFMQQQRLEHRVKIQRLLDSKTVYEFGDRINGELEQQALVEYAVLQNKARVQAEEDRKRLEFELSKTVQTRGFAHTTGVAVIWLNLAVALLATFILFSGA